MDHPEWRGRFSNLHLAEPARVFLLAMHRVRKLAVESTGVGLRG